MTAALPPATETPGTTRSGQRAWPILVLIGLVAFVTTLDNNIVAAAAPSIQRSLRMNLTALQWLSLAYMLSFAGLLLVAGTLIDRWGRRRTLSGGLLLFGIASVVAGFATSLAPLLVARTTQGSAAALMVPATLSLLRTNLDARGRTRGAATWTAALATALAIGPLVGGALSEYLGWGWIFFLNIPFVLVALSITMIHVRDQSRRSTERIDLAGLATVTVAGLALVLAIVGRPSVRGFDLTAPLLLLSLLALLCFAATQRRATNPTVPPTLIRERMFASGLVALLLWGLGISGIFFFTPLLHQEFLGLDPTKAGVPLTIVAGALVLATPLVEPAVRLLGDRTAVGVGLLVVAAGLLAVAEVNANPAVPPRVPGLILIGLGSAFTVPLTSSTLDSIPARYSGIASGLLTVSRELASALGVALVGALLTWQRGIALSNGVAAGPALARGYTAGLILAAALQVLAAVLVLCLFAPRPPRRARII